MVQLMMLAGSCMHGQALEVDAVVAWAVKEASVATCGARKVVAIRRQQPMWHANKAALPGKIRTLSQDTTAAHGAYKGTKVASKGAIAFRVSECAKKIRPGLAFQGRAEATKGGGARLQCLPPCVQGTHMARSKKLSRRASKARSMKVQRGALVGGVGRGWGKSQGQELLGEWKLLMQSCSGYFAASLGDGKAG
ncbi:hypothetical protein L7F22_013539 [Adiantum nelumboides]|nr:hypothetical protein [Adiantum nelumboides]